MKKKGFPDIKKLFTLLTFFALSLFGLWSPSNLLCQNNGFKYLKNYTPNEYHGLDQNLAILQDKRWIIYVANQGGLLEFDGVSWRLIPIKNDAVRSLAMDENGTIYMGGENQIGFLSLDEEKGKLRYKSLLAKPFENSKGFSTVWRTHTAKDGIYFLTSKILFRWNPVSQQMRSWEPSHQNRFNASFICKIKVTGKNSSFTSSKHVLVIYEGSVKQENERASNYWMQFYTSIGDFLKEASIPGQPEYKMWLDKNMNIFYSFTSGIDSNYQLGES